MTFYDIGGAPHLLIIVAHLMKTEIEGLGKRSGSKKSSGGGRNRKPPWFSGWKVSKSNHISFVMHRINSW